MSRSRRMVVAALGLALVGVTFPGCGSDSRDMSANEIVDKAKIGITREQLEDELGEPVADVTTQAGQGVELLEFEARDKQLVAVTIEGGRVSAVRLLGVDGEAQDQPPAAPTTSSPAAP